MTEPRPMFRFTIRAVLWLTVVVGLAVGWMVDHTVQKARELEAVKNHSETLREFRGQIDSLKERNLVMERQPRASENKLAAEPDGSTPTRP